jgi:hypothetical protein
MEEILQPRSSRWPQWPIPAAFLVISWLSVAALAVQPRPGDDVVAVIFPPWWSLDRSLAAAATAGAAIVRTGAVPAIVVVQAVGADRMQRLRRAGALLLIDPRAVAACL